MARTRSVMSALALGVSIIMTSSAWAADASITVAFIPGIASDPFFKAMELGARKAADQLGVKLMWQGSSVDYSPQEEIPFVDAAFANKIDALILVPTDPDSLQASVAKAEALKIPVVTVDTTVTDQTYLTSTSPATTSTAVASPLRRWPSRSAIRAKCSSCPVRLRRRPTPCARRASARRSPSTPAFPSSVSSTPTASRRARPQWSTPSFSITPISPASSQSTARPRSAASRNANRVGSVKLIGYDAYKAEVDAVKEGVVSALVAQQPAREAELALQFAKAKVTGNDVDKIQKNVLIPTVLITKDNLDKTSVYQYVE